MPTPYFEDSREALICASNIRHGLLWEAVSENTMFDSIFTSAIRKRANLPIQGLASAAFLALFCVEGFAQSNAVESAPAEANDTAQQSTLATTVRANDSRDFTSFQFE